MSFKYIDIHAHLNFKDFDEDREKLIKKLHSSSVAVINIGVDLNTSLEALRLAKKNSEMYCSVGLHPLYIQRENIDNLYDKFLNIARDDRVVAIGETGLDHFHLEGNVSELKYKQEYVFRKHIELALEVDKPLMIHCRDAYSDVYKIVKEYEGLRGNIHFFSGTKNEAKQFLDLGYTVSFTGVITFTSQYAELVKCVPMDKLHVETDCPYVAPASCRGKRNEPLNVIEIVKKMAKIKGISEKEMSSQLIKNAEKFFKINISE
jgi:TatD DNase family protein